MKTFIRTCTVVLLLVVLCVVPTAHATVHAGTSPDTTRHTTRNTTTNTIPDTTGRGWVRVSLRDTFPAMQGALRDSLFSRERFPLLGKVITLLSRDVPKGYVFTPLGKNRFSIRSRKTIRPGSVLTIHTLTGSRFVFDGRLIVKKGVSFVCSVAVDCRYSMQGEILVSDADIAYQAPGMVETIDRAIRIMTGKRFVVYKMTGFIDRMHHTVHRLQTMSAARWRAIATDDSITAAGVFPVQFSEEEIAFVAGLLEHRW